MRQANELGGQVRKGEHSQIVVFWKVDRIADSDIEPEMEEMKTKDKRQGRFLLKFYRAFNVDQCNLPQAILEKLPL
jgi:antirestriction protein ArdC